MSNCCRKSGMTLVEVILAISISVMLMAGVFSFNSYTNTSRQAVIEQAEAISIHRALMDRITAELRTATSYPFLRMSIQGTSDSLAIVTTCIPAEQVWDDQSMFDEPKPPQFDLQLIRYRLAIEEDDEWGLIVTGLERVIQKLLTEQLLEEDEEINVRKITDIYKYFRFRFHDGTDWQDQWENTELPLGVEITLGVEPLEEGMLPDDYPYETFVRVVAIPGAQLKQESTAIQGLGGGGR